MVKYFNHQEVFFLQWYLHHRVSLSLVPSQIEGGVGGGGGNSDLKSDFNHALMVISPTANWIQWGMRV